MSKFFDGLKRTEGPIAKLTIDVIGEYDSAEPVRNGHTLVGCETERALQNVFNEVETQSTQPPRFERSMEEGVKGTRSGHTGREETVTVSAGTDVLVDTLPADLPTTDGSPDAAPLPKPASEYQERPSASDLDSRSVEIRLQAGAPLLPFDTGEADVAAEEYRRVRTKIIQHPSQPCLILLSSPAAGDGKSITALNLAGALALNGNARVLLVDMDLRHPTITSLLGVPERDGVAEVLAGTCSLEDAVVRLAPFSNLYLLPAGRDRRNPAELLSSPRWKRLCDELRSEMTYVVLDGPPVEAVAEYSLLHEFSDGLILVVRRGYTIRTLLYRAIESLPKEKLIGTVINDYEESFFWKQRNDYYY